MTDVDYSLLHKALVKRAVKSLKDAQEKNAKAIWHRHESITQKKCTGWEYSWYMYVNDTALDCYRHPVAPIHESLEEEAKKHVQEETRINELIIQISTYIAKVLTLNDQCLPYIHKDLPPFLHQTIKDFNIGFLEKPKLKIRLTEAERKGKEELYALNLLEMTGD